MTRKNGRGGRSRGKSKARRSIAIAASRGDGGGWMEQSPVALSGICARIPARTLIAIPRNLIQTSQVRS